MGFDFEWDRLPLCVQMKMKNEEIEIFDKIVSYLNIGTMRGVVLEKERESILSRIEFQLNAIKDIKERKNG
jgi:hypothetical protein